MSIDCTNLLNLRHLHGKDRGWERPYPTKNACGDSISFDIVRRYGTQGSSAIVTYGNGVVTALQARQYIVEKATIIDCPYPSVTPRGLKDVMKQYCGVFFADICKEGPSGCVLSTVVCSF